MSETLRPLEKQFSEFWMMRAKCNFAIRSVPFLPINVNVVSAVRCDNSCSSDNARVRLENGLDAGAITFRSMRPADLIDRRIASGLFQGWAHGAPRGPDIQPDSTRDISARQKTA